MVVELAMTTEGSWKSLTTTVNLLENIQSWLKNQTVDGVNLDWRYNILYKYKNCTIKTLLTPCEIQFRPLENSNNNGC